MIHLPTLTALRYNGEEPQKFKHLVGVRAFPTMCKGDIILVPSLTAHQLRKKTEYVVVDLNEVFGDGGMLIDENLIQAAIVDPADDETKDETKAHADDETKDETKAPADDETKDETKAPADDETKDETKAPADDETNKNNANSKGKTNPPADSATQKGSNSHPAKGK